MKVLEDFKKFALRGNVLDLAIGFTVGAAFTSVVRSLVDDVIMPPVGLVTGNADFADHFILLQAADGANVPEGGFQTLREAQATGAVTLNYGAFFNACVTLVIVAFAMFLIIRIVNRLDAKLDERFGDAPPQTEPVDKKCEFCRSTIAYRATRCPYCTSQLSAIVVQ